MSVIVPSLGKSLPKMNVPPGTEVIVSSLIGRSDARNDGYERSKGDVLVFLDSDIIVNDSFWGFVDAVPEGYFAMYAYQMDRWTVEPCSRMMVVHRNDFQLFDVRFKRGCEDTDYYLRSLAQGLKMCIIPMYMCEHREHYRVWNKQMCKDGARIVRRHGLKNIRYLDIKNRLFKGQLRTLAYALYYYVVMDDE